MELFSATWVGKEQHKQNHRDHSGMLVMQKRLVLICKWYFDSKRNWF